MKSVIANWKGGCYFVLQNTTPITKTQHYSCVLMCISKCVTFKNPSLKTCLMSEVRAMVMTPYWNGPGTPE